MRIQYRPSWFTTRDATRPMPRFLTCRSQVWTQLLRISSNRAASNLSGPPAERRVFVRVGSVHQSVPVAGKHTLDPQLLRRIQKLDEKQTGLKQQSLQSKAQLGSETLRASTIAASRDSRYRLIEARRGAAFIDGEELAVGASVQPSPSAATDAVATTVSQTDAAETASSASSGPHADPAVSLDDMFHLFDVVGADARPLRPPRAQFKPKQAGAPSRFWMYDATARRVLACFRNRKSRPEATQRRRHHLQFRSYDGLSPYR
eukprot:m.396552 g.396552  ORF g.396552 m.396552 type:complete len:261 (-) comp56411_c0_seq13:226-1008(-)